jgi:hypothetical protein
MQKPFGDQDENGGVNVSAGTPDLCGCPRSITSQHQNLSGQFDESRAMSKSGLNLRGYSVPLVCVSGGLHE